MLQQFLKINAFRLLITQLKLWFCLFLKNIYIKMACCLLWILFEKLIFVTCFVSIVYHITVHRQLENDRIPTTPTECINWFAKAKLNNNFIRCLKFEMKYVYIFKQRWFITSFESFVTKNGFFQPNIAFKLVFCLYM